MTEPGEIAARDQRIADITAKLDRRARRAPVYDGGFAILVLVTIGFLAAARPHVSWWQMAVVLAALAAESAINLVNRLITKSLSDELSAMRAGGWLEDLPKTER